MQRRVTNLIIMVGLPALIGQFIFDWFDKDLRYALGYLPMGVIVISSTLLMWAAFRQRRERKKRTFS